MVNINNVFKVYCQRIRKSHKYAINFPYNIQLIERIRNLPHDERKFDDKNKLWVLTVRGLFEIIKIYKGSNLIYFEFIGVSGKDVFKDLVQKMLIKEKEKQDKLNELEKKKKEWLEFKLDLEENWEKYSDQVHKNLKEGIKLYPHQVAASMFTLKIGNVLISHEMGLGKCQDVDSNLLTPNGWVKMGEININDFVIGSDGTPKRILNIYSQGIKDIYEIKFNDGTYARSCDEHLWNVNTYIRNWRKNPFITKTLRNIINEGLKFKNGNNKHYIPIIKPIKFEEKELLINPYVLGCLLGDGGITIKNSISFTSVDKEIIHNISIRLPKNHKLIKRKNSILEYYLTSDGKNNYINQALKKYNLKGCDSHLKFIPNEYKISSIEQRLELLQGILDTDGHCTKDGIIELTLASKKLIEDTQFIVQSLGGIGRLKEKWIKYKGDYRLYWRLTIKLPSEFIPFKLKRKINNFIPPTKYLPNRAIVDIKYIGKKEAKCILIDSDDHLYATDNCILTHNTLSSIAYIEMCDFTKIIVITPNNLKFNYYNEVNKFTNSKAHIIGWGKKKNKYSIEESKYIIFNYNFFNPSKAEKVIEKFNKLNIGKINGLICDEAHALKNNSNTYNNFIKIFNDEIFIDNKISKVFLSGTPAPSRGVELYNLLHEISPLDFSTKTYFKEYYCGLKYNVETESHEENLDDQKFEELYHKMAPYTHRKRKIDVMKDLPERIYQNVNLEMSDSEYQTYYNIEEGFLDELKDEKQSIDPLSKMIKLRKYLSLLKVKNIGDIIDGILNSGEKVVIVDFFKEPLYELKKLYGDIAVLHTGDEKSLEIRNEMVKEFQDPNSNVKIFLGSFDTTKEGLTLTAATKLILLFQPFVPGWFDQVTSRVHRIGTKSAVNIYSLIYENSLDEYIFQIIESKRRELAKVMDNENYVSNFENIKIDNIIGQVINKMREKHNK